MDTTNSTQRPGLYTAIAAMTLISGVINLFWGFVASASVLASVVGAICLPITILPTILGAFEITYAAKLLSNQPQPVKPSPSIAGFQISMLLYGNVFSAVVGLLNLIFFNDQTVQQHFQKLNENRFVPAPITPPETPATPEEPATPQEPTAPQEPTPPAEPENKKRIRKVAGQ
ncbi:MAG: hypothetical protein IT310_00645 [Anaerolineales bacterium]|nr:hypothetical protein [Anaerolineales bacterium]